jgi:propanol-preferring alcohol dehydrogenase
MGVQIAKAMGMRVIGIDAGPYKRELCNSLGCEAFVDFLEVENVAEEVKRLTDGRGAHGIFVTAGSPAAYRSAPEMVRVGGRVMCIGLRKHIISPPLPPSALRKLTRYTNSTR